MAGQQVSKVRLSRQHFGGRRTRPRAPTSTGAVLVAIDMAKNRQQVPVERPDGATQTHALPPKPHLLLLADLHVVRC